MISTALQIIQNFISPTDWLLIAAIGTSVFVFGFCYYKRKHVPVPYRELILRSLLVSYMGFVIFITLLGREKREGMDARLLPLWSWYDVLHNRNRAHFIEILLNIAQLFPVGILLRLWKHMKVYQVFFAGMLVSVAIELLQLVTCKGCFEWDDILHNALGCMLGALLCGGFTKNIKRKRS